ncbi:bifunctional enoyl-CoA hydratase/phosphate acetyltransferase [Microvirga tunisiensis]|uniref:Bifunctional enoyl-CoA hydratase/phosphate acetyltransferase n=2 Tax=Pannonibacter tanglangensis TaxID=2750084 RepID=A0ABW9ZJ04_9HYPH|nr:MULTISPECIES: bifunctional enoyl-CoA hydratase/phosphate acetyltransferase [unclassified Pannonibacter]NBN64668.1 bifunctional enoyl-CoA hydratase/phosphate acetyltransferase [Pannonibacter sp. XCT-34]NBN79203.1 bifunctional enoyl-CoA hydratase/phosphate acetyltransferase [Pannonibacter sp. XCT-53]
MASNKTYDQISVGDSATVTRVCTANDLYIFAHASGNTNPLHLPNTDWTGDGKIDPPFAPSMWIGALISAVLGNILPGPGTVYRSQSFTFHNRVILGDTLTVSVTVLAKEADRLVRLATRVSRADGTPVADGLAEVTAPDQTITFDMTDLPALLVERHQHFDRLIGYARLLPSLTTAVIAPDDANSLGGALLAAREGLIRPVLIGARSRIEAAAAALHETLDGIEIIDIADESEAAARGVAMVHEGRVGAVMKGHLHTDHLLHHVVKRDGGLRTSRRISHVFVMDVPGRKTPVIISDAAINIAPDLMTKVDIIQNAINVGLAIGMDLPKVGILSAIETVNPAIPSSLDAAVLSKMAERGQITGGLVDGPLAMDNAIDLQAARTKGITSLVAGQAEVLIVPNLESGNMLAKELTFIAHAEAAGLVIGAKVPVMLTSRSDDDRARLASCALALLYDHWLRTGKTAVTGELGAAE